MNQNYEAKKYYDFTRGIAAILFVSVLFMGVAGVDIAVWATVLAIACALWFLIPKPKGFDPNR